MKALFRRIWCELFHPKIYVETGTIGKDWTFTTVKDCQYGCKTRYTVN